MTNRSVILTQSQMYLMQRHINFIAPIEACGLVGGRNDIVELVLPVKNAAESKTRFIMDPKAQLRAIQQIESEGLELLAIFHSHPKGPSTPSETDIAESRYAAANIIWAKTGRRWTARAFIIENGISVEIPLTILNV
ncbi:MAG: M67 family metallopeptidase [Chloroflexota bacterium]